MSHIRHVCDLLYYVMFSFTFKSISIYKSKNKFQWRRMWHTPISLSSIISISVSSRAARSCTRQYFDRVWQTFDNTSFSLNVFVYIDVYVAVRTSNRLFCQVSTPNDQQMKSFEFVITGFVWYETHCDAVHLNRNSRNMSLYSFRVVVVLLSNVSLKCNIEFSKFQILVSDFGRWKFLIFIIIFFWFCDAVKKHFRSFIFYLFY